MSNLKIFFSLSRFDTLDVMQCELMACSYRKRCYQEVTKTGTTTMQDSKRPQLSLASTKCYACGQFGHKSFECSSHPHDKQQTTSTAYRSGTAEATTKPPVTCFKCGAEGHVASRCLKTGPESSSTQPAATASIVKRVDICGVKPVTGVIT